MRSNKKTLGIFMTAFAASVLPWAGAGASNAGEPSSPEPQGILDLIAVAPLDKTFEEIGATPAPTGPFSSWTTDQQHAYPADLGKLCAGFWTFIGGGPGKRVLPASLPGADEVTLVMNVCLIAHMPSDWPERNARLKAAQLILNKANQAGASLHFPAQLRP